MTKLDKKIAIILEQLDIISEELPYWMSTVNMVVERELWDICQNRSDEFQMCTENIEDAIMKIKKVMR